MKQKPMSTSTCSRHWLQCTSSYCTLVSWGNMEEYNSEIKFKRCQFVCSPHLNEISLDCSLFP